MSRTALVDDSGVERLVYCRDPDTAPYDGLVPIQVVLRSPTYEIKARAALGPGDCRPAGLLTIAARAQGDTTYELWGIGDYRIEGPLLTLRFAGDQRGRWFLWHNREQEDETFLVHRDRLCNALESRPAY